MVLVSHPVPAINSGEIVPGESFIANPPWFGYVSEDDMGDFKSISFSTYKDGLYLSVFPPENDSDSVSIFLDKKDWAFPRNKAHWFQVWIGTDEVEHWSVENLDWERKGAPPMLAASSLWPRAADPRMIFPPSSISFLTRLKKASTLTIKAVGVDGEITAIFDVSGLVEIMESHGFDSRFPVEQAAE